MLCKLAGRGAHRQEALGTLCEMLLGLCSRHLLSRNVARSQIQNEVCSIDEVGDGVAQLVEPFGCQLSISVVDGMPTTSDRRIYQTQLAEVQSSPTISYVTQNHTVCSITVETLVRCDAVLYRSQNLS